MYCLYKTKRRTYLCATVSVSVGIHIWRRFLWKLEGTYHHHLTHLHFPEFRGFNSCIYGPYLRVSVSFFWLNRLLEFLVKTENTVHKCIIENVHSKCTSFHFSTLRTDLMYENISKEEGFCSKLAAILDYNMSKEVCCLSAHFAIRVDIGIFK